MKLKSEIIDFVLKEAKISPTKEMIDFFNKRTNNHIKLVQKYCKQIADKHPEFKELIERGTVHDQSKLEEPELTPYIFITWKYKNPDFKISEAMDKRMSQATEYHVKNNAHHPESHSNQSVSINRKDRDKPPSEIIDATKMTDLDIAEMCADWRAMSEEKGNTAKSWADKNVNIRWKFTDEQKDLIYSLL